MTGDRELVRDDQDTGDLLAPVWRYKWAIFAVTLAAALATYFALDARTRTYEATTSILIQQSELERSLIGENQAAYPDRDVNTQAQVLVSRSVALGAARLLDDGRSTGEITQNVEAAPGEDSDVITITFQDSEPRRAAETANAIVASYVAIRSRTVRQRLATSIRVAERELRDLQGSDASRAAVRRQESRVRRLRASASLPASTAEPIDRAVPPTSAIAPKPVRGALFAAFLAFSLACLVALAFSRLDRRLRTPADIEEATGLPRLAALPQVKDQSSLLTDAAVREAARGLRSSLMLSHAGGPPRVIAITSALPGEGKSTVSVALAHAYAEAGQRPVLVDADLHRPAISTLLDAPHAPGLAEVLAGTESLEDAIRELQPGTAPGDDSVISVLAGRVAPPNPQRLLEGDALARVTSSLVSSFDVVIIDTPPILAVSDGLAIGTLSEAMLFVARLGIARRDAVAEARARVARLPGVPVAGLVVNGVSRRDLSGIGYYSYSSTSVNEDSGALIR